MASATTIGIDGDYGAGKTHLGAELARLLDGVHVKLDDFLLGNGTPYFQQLDKIKLAAHLEGVRPRRIIIEGMHLLDVADALGITLEYLVFAKCYVDDTREQDKYLRTSAPLPRSKTTKQLTEYYRRRKPDVGAHLTVKLYGYLSPDAASVARKLGRMG